jgi:hypothetical protein
MSISGIGTTIIQIKDDTEVTLATGTLTITQSYHSVNSESGASDDLATISLGTGFTTTSSIATYRPFVVLQAASGDTITVKHGTGNISLNGAADFVLTGNKHLLLFYNGSVWADLGAGGSGGGSGAISADTLVLNDGSELTIATGAITVTKARHTVDTEADAASDDLVTINGLAAGEICIISANHTDRTVVVKNGTGNIACSTGADISLDATEKEVLLYGRASTVLAIPLYNLGSGGGSGANTALSNLASVAINTSLVSDTDNTDDLGSASIQWKDIWAKSSYANTVAAAYNNSGGTIATEQVVYISGHNAGTDEPTIALADRDSGATAYAVGITQASINNAASGRIVTQGIATYPTTGMTAGDLLYLSSTAGGLTNTKPTSGYLQLVAVVIEVGGTGAGRILFVPQAPLDLDSLGGGGLYTSVAILRDEKATTTAGGSASATTWNNRNLNTETYDPDNIVSIASNQFTPIAGDYEINVAAVAFKTNQNRLRLYNATGAASVEEGISQSSNSADNSTIAATLACKFTANGTDAYRIDHYTAAAQATTGLGAAVSDGSAEVYMEIILRKLS